MIAGGSLEVLLLALITLYGCSYAELRVHGLKLPAGKGCSGINHHTYRA